MEKMDFRAKICFSAKRKNGRFALTQAGTRFVVSVGHFFGGLDGPSFVDHGPILKVLILGIGH